MAADFAMTAKLLASRNIACSVSEIHGVLTGQVCAQSAGYDPALSQEILEIESNAEEVITSLLNMLADDIHHQFKTEEYTFQPLLPDDDTGLSSRLSALAEWCDGFNAGFAGAWVKDDPAIPEETREVLEDYARVAQVDKEDDEVSTKESEVNYMEVVEYVRMAAITVYLQNVEASSQGLAAAPGDDNIH